MIFTLDRMNKTALPESEIIEKILKGETALFELLHSPQ